MALALIRSCSGESDPSDGENLRVKLEGKVSPPDYSVTGSRTGGGLSEDWYWRTKVVVDGGKFVGFIKEDNTFAIHGLPAGSSYLVEVVNPNFAYEPVRVDISSKGKIRARKNNQIQPNQVTQVPYPLKFKSAGKFKYFQKREEWKVTDIFMNPMVVMMVMPLLLVTILPKMMNDPDTKKEMEQMQQNMNVQNQLPDMSEMMANLFGGGGNNERKKKPKPVGSAGVRR